MSNSSTQKLGAVASQTSAKTRKPYHAPKMENFGPVNAVTGSGNQNFEDNQLGFSSTAG